MRKILKKKKTKQLRTIRDTERKRQLLNHWPLPFSLLSLFLSPIHNYSGFCQWTSFCKSLLSLSLDTEGFFRVSRFWSCRDSINLGLLDKLGIQDKEFWLTLFSDIWQIGDDWKN